MSNLPKPPQIPKIQDLYTDLELAKSNDELVALLNQPPNPSWIKTHPYISNYRYLPIDKVEYLLKTIFKKYKIEIIREGVAFNGVYVIVRVWYLNPTTNEMDYHDGIGAKELQVKKGSSAADLANINSGALQMAFPIAKTVAIKDACDHFGTLFGSDINRKDVMYILPDDSLSDKSPINEINDIVSPVINQIEVISPETISNVAEPASPPSSVPSSPNDEDDF
jgi:hypothetical protein